MGKQSDLTKRKFDRLTAIRRNGTAKNGAVLWLCECECGKTKTVQANHLTSGYVKSCGCLHNQRASENCIRRTVHGDKRGEYRRLYRVWVNMRSRCSNQNHKAYNAYGGRGITVCAEWNSYPDFKEWAISAGYDPDAPYGKLTLDRIDNDKGYSPDNCRWVDMKVQAHNRRSGRAANGQYTAADGDEDG